MPCFAPGDRVATTEGTGSHAEYMVLDAEKALPVPDGVSDDVAAALPAQGITAHYLINSSYRVQPGDTVLTYAGAGGVGLTGGRGVDVVYDGIGRDTFEGSLDALRVRGTLVQFGGASGQVPPFDLQQLNAHGSLTVTRPKIDDFLLDAEERRWRSQELFGLVADGTLKVSIGARYPLEQAGDAHTAMESRATTGKILLLPAAAERLA